MRRISLAVLLSLTPLACAADRPSEAGDGGFVTTLDPADDDGGAGESDGAGDEEDSGTSAGDGAGDGSSGPADDDGGGEASSSGGADTGSGGAGGPTGTYELDAIGALVYAPPGVHELGPVPVAFAFHGAGDSASNFLGVLLQGGSWQSIADDTGLVVIAFEGQTPQTEWTYPVSIPGWNLPTGQGDVDRVRDALDYVRGAYDVDPARVYTIGFSMGATMATAVALELDADVAAFVAVAQGTPVSDYGSIAPESGYAVAGLMQGDPQDPIYASIPYTADLLATNGHDVEVREFPGTGHVGSWMASTVYDPAPEQVWSWLAAHSRAD